MPFACMASTIVSLSVILQRTSLVPWKISIGFLMRSTLRMGERSASRARPFRRARIAVAAIHELGKPRPIGRHRLEQGLQVGNADDGHTAAEDLRRESGTNKRSKAAVGPAEDRDP